MMIREFPPKFTAETVRTSGGRVQSISVHPTQPKHVIIATQFCGLWKTEDGGSTWFHLDGLLTVFVRDVAYAPDGNTVIATVQRDNQVKNGGGIWLSRDGGRHWERPSSGDPHDPINSKLRYKSRIPSRINAYGISYSPDEPKKVYVGTDYGVAISTDNGKTWFHKMLEHTSPVQADIYGLGQPSTQNSVISILALPNDKAIALCGTGVYFTEKKFKEGEPWTWNCIKPGNFIYQPFLSCKNIDVWPLNSNKIFILQDYYHLWLYELDSKTPWTEIKLPPLPKDSYGNDYKARGPFIRVSRQSLSLTGSSSSIDIWVGLGLNLVKASCIDIKSVKSLKSSDWKQLGGDDGLHGDAGYLGLNSYKIPVFYGDDGGLFYPTNDSATKWARAASPERGFNSYQISDLAGTNIRNPGHTCLYFTTQDNSIWASGDSGLTWPDTNRVCCEGCHLQVTSSAESDDSVRVASAKFDGGDNTSIFSKAHLEGVIPVPDVATDGTILTDMYHAFYISPKKWIRLGNFTYKNTSEIYVSVDNGEHWRKKANVALDEAGIFVVSRSFYRHPPSYDIVVYAPFKGNLTGPDGSNRVGLIRFTDLFSSTVDDYDEGDLIYLDDNGSLGIRATEFDHHAVYGVDPNNPNYIIAPDIHNDRVMISRDGGVHWNIDINLTREVTKSKTILLYGGNVWYMQVTAIAFDPYNSNRIYVGTRDLGVILSTDAGKSWSTIPYTNMILYITNFFFGPRGDTVTVSSYGRGLWKIFHNTVVSPFPWEIYCRGARDCMFRFPFAARPPVYETINWHDNDVIIFLHGRINGLILSGRKIKKISVTPGSTFKRYLGKTIDYSELSIVESEQGEGFDGLKGCLAAIHNGEIIKGVILKENELFGIISGKREFKEQENKSVEEEVKIITTEGDFKNRENEPDYKFKDKKRRIRSKNPYLFIRTSIRIMGTRVVGMDGIISLFATGFKFIPKTNSHVKIMIGSQVINKKVRVMQNGNVESQIRIPKELTNGEHIVKIVQKINRKVITASGSIVKASIDDNKDMQNEN